jgi:exodeoxyribonuclease VII small subunit
MNFETTFNELETIIEKMETGQLSLEDSLKCFEEGVKLSRVCQKVLKEAEQKVQILMEENGEIKAEPFLTE